MIDKLLQWLNGLTCPKHEFHCVGDFESNIDDEHHCVWECIHCGKIEID